MNNLANIDDDLTTNPEKYGFCSFEDFRKNPDKWRPYKDQLLRSVDNGAQDDKLRGKIRDYRYYCEGYRCDTLEEVERLSREMAIDPFDLKVGRIVKEKVDNGKERLHVHFMSKQTIDTRRKTW